MRVVSLALLGLGGCAWIGAVDRDAFFDQDGDGLAYDADCDDNDPSVSTGLPLFADADGDGHGDPNAPVRACDLLPDTALVADDCDDADPATYGGAVERCGGGDEDCDGGADDLDPEGALDATRWYVDADADGHGTGDPVASCAPLSGRAASGTDCDDADGDVHPGAEETCDGVDSDCDFRLDDADADTVGKASWYADTDGDGFGDPASAKELCTAPGGYVALGTDCDDQEASISPAAQERCGGGDEDCDALVDDADPNVLGTVTWYTDADADGYGDLLSPDAGCLPTGRVADTTDCDDTRASVNPAAQEVCDAGDLDEDCDGAVDDVDADATGQGRYYVDGDGDAHGLASAIEYWCDPPADVSALGDDCDDLRVDVYPGANETPYDGVDADCDFASDDDADLDGHDDLGHGGDDCNDALATTHPGAPEVWYDGEDADCDGASDFDQDGDGYDDDGYAGDDCDDLDADVNPGAAEVWYDGFDQDCAGDDDFDQDHDGHRAATKGGTDCDDTEATTYVGADEFVDGVDSDCDGKDYVCGDTIRRVPLDLPTPQAAILASCPGDTVRVAAGDWPGPYFVNLAITIEGVGPATRLVGDGTARVLRAVSRVTLRDLTITGGVATGYPGGAGFLLENATGSVFDGVVLEGNASDNGGGGGTILNSGFVRLSDFVARDNVGTRGGALMVSATPDLEVLDSTFEGNTSLAGGGAVSVFAAHRMVVDGCTFEDNAAASEAGAVWVAYSDDFVIARSVFSGNSASEFGAIGVSGPTEGATGWVLEDLDVVDNVATGNTGAVGLHYSDDCAVRDLRIHRNSGTYAGISTYQAACAFEDLDVRENIGIGVNLAYTPAGITFERATIDNNQGGGLLLSYGTNAVVRDVSLRGNRVYGVSTSGPATFENLDVRDTINTSTPAVSLRAPIVRGLSVRGSSGAGVRLYDALDVEGLVSVGNGTFGLDLNTGATGRVAHATLVGNGQMGLNTYFMHTDLVVSHVVSAYNLVGIDADPGAFTIEHCNLAGNGSGPTQGGYTAPQCGLAAPRFQTYGVGLDSDLLDVHLAPGSPLRDAGAAGADADGTAGDLGAYGGLGDWLSAVDWYDDADLDTLPDGWERDHGLDPTVDDRALDRDGDGVTNVTEYSRGTVPDRADTDDDGIPDATEAADGTDPLSPYDP